MVVERGLYLARHLFTLYRKDVDIVQAKIICTVRTTRRVHTVHMQRRVPSISMPRRIHTAPISGIQYTALFPRKKQLSYRDWDKDTRTSMENTKKKSFLHLFSIIECHTASKIPLGKYFSKQVPYFVLILIFCLFPQQQDHLPLQAHWYGKSWSSLWRGVEKSVYWWKGECCSLVCLVSFSWFGEGGGVAL